MVFFQQSSFCDSEYLELYTYLTKHRIVFINFSSGKLRKIALFPKYLATLVKNEQIIEIYQSLSGIYPAKLLQKLFPKRNAISLFLNHGWGTKRSPGHSELSNKKNLKLWRLLKKNIDYVICYSDFDGTYFLKSDLLDDIPDPQFVPLGHPRNDFVVRNADNEQLKEVLKKRHSIPLNRIVVLFAPTHRTSSPAKLSDYDQKLMRLFLNELEKVDKYLASKRMFLVFKPHYFVKESEYLSQNFSNVKIISNEDPRNLMIMSDILLTDYSSIFVDYLLLQRRIVFYQRDLEYYQKIRGLVIDTNNPVHMPGPKISKLEEILELTQKDFQPYDLQKSRSFFHKYWDDKASERLAEFILKLLSQD